MTRRIEPDTEVTILALADQLGISRPTFTRSARLELWQCWADRVLAAARMRERGLDPSAAMAEAERYGGNETDEIRVLKIADRLSIPRPMARRDDQPEVWSWWADVVRMADVIASAGGDYSELRTRAIRLDGSANPWPSATA